MSLRHVSELYHVCKQGPQNPVEMSPLQCLRSADFWMLFAINGICSGAGLTLLNNVGQQVGAAPWYGDCALSAVMLQHLSRGRVVCCLGSGPPVQLAAAMQSRSAAL